MFPSKVLVILLAFFLVEFIWALAKKAKVYSGVESLANLGVFLGNQILRPISFAWKAMVFSWVFPYRIMDLPETPLVFLLTFFLVEFVYYIYHRLSHEVPLLWAIHHTHHSGSYMNLTSAIRLNWMGGFIAPLFYVPLVFLGFPPSWVIFCLLLGLFFQYFLHTQAIGSLGRFEGVLLNTPSAHRVHHGSNPEYLDKNYGAMLIIFDRLFSTYKKEHAPVKYGVTTGPMSKNPLRIVFSPMVELLRGKTGTGLFRRSCREKVSELRPMNTEF